MFICFPLFLLFTHFQVQISYYRLSNSDCQEIFLSKVFQLEKRALEKQNGSLAFCASCRFAGEKTMK